MARELTDRLNLPPSLLEGKTSLETLVRRHPKLKPKLSQLQAQFAPDQSAEAETDDDEEEKDAGEVQEEPKEPSPALEPMTLEHTLLYSKILLNVFGTNPDAQAVTAQQYRQWQEDLGVFAQMFGMDPAEMGGNASPLLISAGGPGGGPGGNRSLIDDAQLREELRAMESDLIKRMDLREALKDDELAARIPATLPIIEQLMHDKSNLSGTALANAKKIMRSYIDQLAEVLRKEVMQSQKGPPDRSVPPKRVFRNLDLKRTIWKNLPNYDPESELLYVDRLFYKQRSRKELMKYFVVVVDQSGSMLDAMTQCAILASIFASLPNIDVSLIAYDTAVVDLTDWAQDPFEALMRTNLGGGNDGPLAMEHAREKIQDPQRTTMVWISDFYERRELMPMIREVIAQGVYFIPVGSVSGTGYFSVDDWFRKEFKQIGRPVFTGNIKKLISELKTQLT
ncbi:MAG: VWA domain-containing protein [Candidatus Methylacidiphilales bacterium]|nr:VWA domain-containing protein [Candidatus Methylacidiphilales bacterium]